MTSETPASENEFTSSDRSREAANEQGGEPSPLSQSSSQTQNGLHVVIPSMNLNEGTFERPHFGSVTNTKHVEANKIEKATIIHYHHNYSAEDSSTSSNNKNDRQDSRMALNAGTPKGYTEISEDIYMYPEKPMKKGTNVYRGFQVHITGQRQGLAIKKITPCQERSIREVQHLVNLSPHPNVVRILRSKVHEGLTHKELYIVMELCKDQNLQDVLNENKEKMRPFDMDKAMSFAKQLVKAIKHIHRNGIIHGDLKPENILFSLDGELIKVSDFGISKQLRDSKSKTAITGCGTDGYRAPETYSSDHISKSADIYSLGIILFALFANGAHPFGSDPHLCIYNIKMNIGLDFSALPQEMDPLREMLISLLRKIFQLDPKKRPSIKEVQSCPLFLDTNTQEVSPHGRNGIQHREMECAPISSHAVTPLVPDVISSASPCSTAASFSVITTNPLSAMGLSFGATRQIAPPGGQISSDDHATSSSNVNRRKDWSANAVDQPRNFLQENTTTASSDYPAIGFSQDDAIDRSIVASSHITSGEPGNLLDDLMAMITSWNSQENSYGFSSGDADTGGQDIGTKTRCIGVTKRKSEEIYIDLDKLKWQVTRFNRLVDVIPNIKSGCRICHDRGEESSGSNLSQLKVKINGCEKSVSDLYDIRMQELWPTIWPGIVVWFDQDTSTLFAYNLCDKSLRLKFSNECERRSKILLPSRRTTAIFSLKKLTDFVGAKRGTNGCRLPGIEFDDGCLGKFKMIPCLG